MKILAASVVFALTFSGPLPQVVEVHKTELLYDVATETYEEAEQADEVYSRCLEIKNKQEKEDCVLYAIELAHREKMEALETLSNAMIRVDKKVGNLMNRGE